MQYGVGSVLVRCTQNVEQLSLRNTDDSINRGIWFDVAKVDATVDGVDVGLAWALTVVGL